MIKVVRKLGFTHRGRDVVQVVHWAETREEAETWIKAQGRDDLEIYESRIVGVPDVQK